MPETPGTETPGTETSAGEAVEDATFEALDRQHDQAHHIHSGMCCWPFPGVTTALREALAAAPVVRGQGEAVVLTEAERADLLNAACRAHSGPATFVCRPCADAQDAVIERILADRLASSAQGERTDVAAVLAAHVRISWAEKPFTCSCDPDTSDARSTHQEHVLDALAAASVRPGPTEAGTVGLCGQCGERESVMVKVGTTDGWCVECLDEAADPRTDVAALLAAADEMSAVIAEGDSAEAAAPVPGEVGRSTVVGRGDALYEEPDTWLREYAARVRPLAGTVDDGLRAAVEALIEDWGVARCPDEPGQPCIHSYPHLPKARNAMSASGLLDDLRAALTATAGEES